MSNMLCRNALMGSVAFICVVAAMPAAAQMTAFDVPTQSAVTGIAALARQANIQIVSVRNDTRSKRINAIRGEMTVDAALDALLAGTGLRAQKTGSQTWAISAVEARGESAPNNAALQENGAGKIATEFESAEIVVTAQKRTERLIEVPQSLSVVTGNDLQKSGATQFRDFAPTVPALSFTTAGAGNTQITLRGVSVGFDISPTVGIYVDEVPYGASTVFSLGGQYTFDPALIDLDRIEVLRGPQGTLYGASTMGGLIKYVTPLPNTNVVEGSARAGISSSEHGGINYILSASANIPLSVEKVALRVTGFQSHDGGYIDNRATGQKDVNRSDTYGARADLLITPTDRLSVRFSGYLQNIARDGEATTDYTFAQAKPNGKLGQRRPFREPFDYKFRLISGTLNYDFEWATLTSSTAYQTTRNDSIQDLSGNYAPLLNSFGFGPFSAVGLTNLSRTKKFTQELRLSSSKNNRIEWVIGGYFNRERSSLDEQFLLRDLAGNPATNNIYTYAFPSTYREVAGFGDITWHISDKFDLTGGIRYARNSQVETQTGSGALVGSYPTVRAKDDVFTYLANARYRFSNHVTAYIRYATGYRPGGANVQTIAGGPASFSPDRLKSYEAGVKAETEDRRFGIDFSAYYIDWSKPQSLKLFSGFASYVNATADASIRGSEITLTARPVDGLVFAANAAYVDAELSGADIGLGAAKGERLPNSPRFSAHLGADYTLSEDGLRPTLGFSVRHVGKRFVSFNANASYPQYALPSYTTIDLRGGLAIGKFDAQLYVHNVTDNGSQLGIIFPQYGARVAIAQPRTFGLAISTRF